MKERKKGATEKRPYKSRFCERYIGPSQYLAEIVCDRKANSEGVKLIPRFWQGKDEWAKEFKRQTILGGKLLKNFDIKYILLALDKSKWCWSLGSPSLIKIIRVLISTSKNLSEYKIKTEIEEKFELPDKISPFIEKKSELDKLKELDNE